MSYHGAVRLHFEALAIEQQGLGGAESPAPDLVERPAGYDPLTPPPGAHVVTADQLVLLDGGSGWIGPDPD